ncbi:PTS sugar transporter subunit IIA [Brevibacillus laterosporus]|uniref:PTS sugar transporter subunit IIA n=1 Tax=Brevibacillus laterosporus TaxID=1465 RepID=UPI00399D2358
MKVNLVFLLAIKAPNGQVNILQELMSIIQDTALLNNLLTSEKENEISAALVNLKL